MEIRRLADAPDSLPDLARLIRDVWPDWYGSGGEGDAAEDLANRSGRTGVPLGFVALDRIARPVGTVALGLTGHGAAPEEGPWINGLAVAATSRGRGIGSALVAAAEAEARRQGYPRAFTAAREAAGLFRRRGWVHLRDLPDGWSVLLRDFDASGPARSAR